jgi:hypothetical protein
MDDGSVPKRDKGQLLFSLINISGEWSKLCLRVCLNKTDGICFLYGLAGAYGQNHCRQASLPLFFFYLGPWDWPFLPTPFSLSAPTREWLLFKGFEVISQLVTFDGDIASKLSFFSFFYWQYIQREPIVS